MNSEVRMSVSSLTRTKDNKAIYILFNDKDKEAEFSIPGCKLISNKGFSDEEISELSDYINNNMESIYDLAKTINPIKAMMKC